MQNEAITVWGNIGRIEKCEKRAEAGRPASRYVKFSVAVDRKLGDTKDTVWYTVIMNGAQVNADPDAVVELYSVGKRVLVNGRLDVNAFPSTKNPGQIFVERTIYPLSRPTLI